MKKCEIFLWIIMFCLFFSNRAYSQSVDVNIGTKSANFGYTDVRYNCESNNYELTITRPMRLFIDATIFTDIYNGAYLDFYDGSDNFYTTEYIPGTNSEEFKATIETGLLPAGTYTISSNQNGCGISFQITVNGSIRDIFRDSTPIGSFDNDFTYTDTQNTDDYWDDYGAYGNDVYYQFTLNRQMDLTISHCGSNIDNTYLYLLNSSGNCIASSNTSGDGGCFSNNAYLKKVDLLAGTYYIVSNSAFSGNLTTTVNGYIPHTDLNTGQNQNYILEITPTIESSDARDLSLNQCIQKVQYYDGLGRQSQTVQRGFSTSGKDLVVVQEYDDFGRESNVWLPTPCLGNGSYTDPSTIIATSRTSYADNSPYSSSVYEASPLNRVLQKYGPGENWRAKEKSVKTAFCTNDNNLDNLKCSYYYVTSDNKLVKSGNYDNGQLYVTRTMDEDDHEVFEFKDKLGYVILIRQRNNNQNYDTYYVYDDFGNRCFVLPPSASLGLSDTIYTGTEELLKNFAYVYQYDYRKRCIYKKLPGADPIYMIYDKADHLIFSQDGEQRKKMTQEWNFYIPDAFGRIVLTGICKDSLTYTADPLKNIVLKADWTKTITAYKGYKLLPETFTLSSPIILNVNYYDSYDFMDPNVSQSVFDSNFNSETGTGYGEQYTGGYNGLLTGKITALLDGSGYLYNVIYYDNRGRVIQTKATNHLTGGYDKDYFLYTFTGKIKKHQHVQSATGKATITEVNENFYDNAERLAKTTHSLNGSTPVILVENTYDDMGRLQSKKQHGGIETTNYAYNLRSWLKSINTAKSLFSETLYYDESSNGSIKCYNGNIGAMNWKVQNDTQRGYNFHYDDLNRITAADYQNNNANTDNNYSTTYAYDNMGNIKNLRKNGLANNDPYKWEVIDSLTLNYNGNQLSGVTDESKHEPSYTGAFNFVKVSSGTPEYTYDANGNLTRDSHKKIAKIQYNILNLPKSIFFVSKDTTEYLYDAEGVKRRVFYKTGEENALVSLGTTLATSPNILENTWTDYCGNVIYENGTLSRILVDGGYITMNGTTPTYHYYIQDHLGNNRVVFNQSGTIEQTNHYYPFGMTFGEGIDNSNNRYKYNGKELDRMHGLDLYDYGARHYDAAIGRWGVMDPLAEKYYSTSPYVYCANNPIKFIDPDGKEKIIAYDPTGGNNKRELISALKYKDNNFIHIFAHGDSKTIYAYKDGKGQRITSKRNLVDFLSKYSATWKNRKKNEHITIVLHSCNTGNEKNGDLSVARDLSELENVSIIAPDEEVVIDNKTNEEKGSYDTFEGEDKKTYITESRKGHWIQYDNGMVTKVYNGNWGEHWGRRTRQEWLNYLRNVKK